MALECALALQLEHKHFVTAPKTNDRKLTTILKVAAMYKSTVPPDTASVMVEVGRYRDHLLIERHHQFVLPKWTELTLFAVECGRAFQSEISCVVSKGTECIFVHFHFPLLAQMDHEFDVVEPLLFDAVPRPKGGLDGAHFLKFEDADSLESHLSSIWPKGTEVDTVSVEAMSLNPNLRTRPKIVRQEMQRDFDALAVRMQSVGPSPKQQHFASSAMSKAESNGNGQNAVNAVMAMEEEAAVRGQGQGQQQHIELRPDPNLKPFGYPRLEPMAPNMNMDRNHAQPARSALNPNAVPFDATTERVNPDGDRERVLILEATVKSLEDTVNELKSERDALRMKMDQNGNGQNENAEILKLTENRNYLIKQLQQRNDELTALRADFERQRQEWMAEERKAFSTQFQQMVRSKDSEIEIGKAQVASLQQQVEELKQLLNAVQGTY